MITQADIKTFFLVELAYSGTLAWIGDKGLAPVRYLFNGVIFREGLPENFLDQDILNNNTIQVYQNPHVVASFSSESSTDVQNLCKFASSGTSKFRTFAAVIFLIPGLVLSVFKLLGYMFSDLRNQHWYAAARGVYEFNRIVEKNDGTFESKTIYSPVCHACNACNRWD